jgi:hypothetical protein
MAYGLWDQLNWLTKKVKALCCAITNINKEAATNNPPYVEIIWDDPTHIWTKLSYANADLDGNFTSLITFGNIQRLYGGSNITISSGYMTNKTIVSIDDPSGMIVGISYSQFYNCAQLEYVNLPKAQIIGSQTFVICTSLRYVNIPATLQLGDQCFNTCTALETININSCTSIDNLSYGAFPNVSGVNVTIKLLPSMNNDPSILNLIAQGNTVTLIAP